MAISFNTGATGSAVTATSATLGIPAGVLAGDVMLLIVEVFTQTGTTPTVSISGGGGSWTLVPMTAGTNPEVATAGSSIWSYGYAYYRVATAGDPGATLTISETGSAAASTWISVAVAAYTGASTTTPIDVAFGSNAQGVASTTAPSGVTVTPGDWAVYLAAAGINSPTLSGPGTSRELVNSSANIDAAIRDSNGSAGAAGTSIGGGTWTQGGNSSSWFSLFTIGLAPPGSGSVAVAGPPLRIPHPLWFDLLEVAATRADWQAQGVASIQAQHWRLMDGANGRPGVASSGTQPPASATANAGNMTNGLSFYVTQGGMWFEGYWYYVCASGQATAPQKFALWSTVSSASAASSVVPGSVVTSGTLTAGQWNYIPLPQPVQLALWGIYVAAAGVPAGTGYPDTAGQFGSGQPYSSGIVSGPLTAFSDLGAGNPAPAAFGQSATTSAGADPAASLPAGALASHDNLWLDVQVTNAAPAGYSGSYRLWPNMTDADWLTAVDSAVNYVIGTEIIISQPVYVNAIWYFLPSGTAQFATSADIWRVRDGVRVATQPSPAWCKAGGGPATSTSGASGTSQQWAYTQLPGPVYLPPGDYYVTVYDGAATPDGWGAKRLGYWEAYNQAPDGTYKNTPPGAGGITAGPLYAPPTPLASDVTDYSTAAREPGQSVFAVGPPNQVPNLYVGGSSAGIYTGPALFQNYWVDLEVTPAALWTPDAPDLPRRLPHPLYTQLLEVAAERMLPGTTPSPPAATPGPAPYISQNSGMF